ncbi:MAG: undecaprenyl/decaprenyl-phosphate alpha-N-acetylglucosaminyl 1-phosphate transferase [Phycisphaerae bacterium]|nr:undecaprenyl/decaprenyl-phosphate alpha-N-acetylglucosaminyl 1-phosphate transferase [Phycisphaerae bacterium]
MKTYIFTYALALLLSTIFTPLVIFAARSLGVNDAPNARSVHTKSIPRLGGLAIFLAMMSVAVPMLIFDDPIGHMFLTIATNMMVLLSAGAFIFMVGFIDDLVGIRARTKFLAQIVAAVVVCYFGIRIDQLSVGSWFSIDFGWWSWPITILWIAGVTNAVNLIDGLDGLAAGISSIVCGTIAVLSIYMGQPVMAVIMLAMLGSLSGFLLFNFNPARIFMGDCGSLFLGFILATSSVMCASKSTTIVGLALPFIALGVPIFDMLFSMLRRLLERRSMFSADRGHVHHRLLDIGLKHRHVVLVIYAVTMLATALGLFMMMTQDASTVIIFVAILLLLVLFFRTVGAVRLRHTLTRVRSNLQIKKQKKNHQRSYETSILHMRNATDFDSWWQAVCVAGDELDFIYLAIRYIDRDGQSHNRHWQNEQYEADDKIDIKCPMANIIQAYFPVRQRRDGAVVKVEVGMPVDDVMEYCGHRMGLFTRLLDEYSIADLPVAARPSEHSWIISFPEHEVSRPPYRSSSKPDFPDIPG